mgnify:CR=1 FL=1
MAGRARTYEQRAEELLAPIAERRGCRVYDVEYVREGPSFYLRCYIDRDGGVTIGDCEAVSREMSDALDAHDFIQGEYVLEVSSPGLGRALTKDRHLAASVGQEVELRLYAPQQLGGYAQSAREFEGVLRDWDAESVTVEMPGADTALFRFLRADIAAIRLKLEL